MSALTWAWLAPILLAMLGFLIRISFQMGGLVQRFTDHADIAEKVHKDQEARLRLLELGPRLP